MRALVTGATGFVGQALCAGLIDRGWDVVAAGRTFPEAIPRSLRFPIDSMTDAGRWKAAAEGVDVTFHLAGRAHVQKLDDMEAFAQVNVAGTRVVAETAVEAGVKRVVYLSSAKVNGERSGSRGFRESDPAAPQDAYGQTKWEAEQVLAEVCAGSMVGFSIVRTPLVYGPNVRANFLRLIHMVDRELPLPLGRVDNARSLSYVGNLVDGLIRCAADDVANDTFYVADAEVVSTPELVRAIARVLDRRPRLIGVPLAMIKTAGAVPGLRGTVERLTSTLVVDTTKIRATLGWSPSFTLDEGLAETIRWYREQGERAA